MMSKNISIGIVTGLHLLTSHFSLRFYEMLEVGLSRVSICILPSLRSRMLSGRPFLIIPWRKRTIVLYIPRYLCHVLIHLEVLESQYERGEQYWATYCGEISMCLRLLHRISICRSIWDQTGRCWRPHAPSCPEAPGLEGHIKQRCLLEWGHVGNRLK